MASLFVSYSRRDIEAARKLTEAFKGPDLDFWIDWEGIRPTVDWWREIEKGIEETDIFLFLLSPDSGSSKVCRQEIEHAVKNGKRLIPIVVRDIPASEAPSELRPLNWIFLREEDNFRAAFSKLMQAIKTDHAWVQAHRQLQVKALEWERNNHENSLLLRGKELQDAELQLATNSSKEPHPTDLQREYVLRSRQASDRQRRLARGGAVAVIISLGILVVIAFVQAKAARSAEATAVANEQEAIRQANIALARQLAAQAQRLYVTEDSQQQTAVLLAIQSLSLLPVDEAARVLQDSTLAKPVAHMVHDDLVKSATFSADGNYVVSGSDDHTARVWEVESGKEIARVTHGEGVNSVAFSPDGKYVVSGSNDGAIRVWETFTGKEITRMEHDYGVYTVLFSPDGNYVASGGCDQQNSSLLCVQGSARIWETATGKEVARVGHDDSVSSVVFSPDGNYVVSGSDDGAARVWEAGTGKEISGMPPADSGSSVAFSPDSKYVVSAGGYGVHVWEAATGTEVAKMETYGPVYSVAFSPDGNYVASGGCVVMDIQINCLQGYFSIGDVATGKEVILIPHDNVVHKVAFSLDGRYVVSGSEDGIVRLWKASTGKEVARMTHGAPVSSVAFSLDGNYVVSTGDQIVRVWRADMRQEIIHMPVDQFVTSFAFSLDSKHIAYGGCDQGGSTFSCPQGFIAVREVGTGKEVARMMHVGIVSEVAFSPNGKYIVSGSREGIVRVWETGTGKEITRLVHGDSVWSVAFSPDGKYVVSASREDIVRVWEAATGKETAHMMHEGIVSEVAFSPDGGYVVSGSHDHTARVWEAATGKEISRLVHGDLVWSVAFSPDGKYVVSTSDDDTARVWEAATGKEIARIDHDRLLHSLAISPDGKYVVSAGEFIIYVWETATGKVIVSKTHEALGRPAEIVSVAFSPDGRYIVSTGLDNTAAVWEALTGKEIAHMTHGIERSSVYAVFSPDGKYVASQSEGDAGDSIHIWESFTGNEIAHISQSEETTLIRFSPDGKYILASRGAGGDRLWAYRPLDLMAEACLRVTRNLTHEEWIQYIGDTLPYQAVCGNLPPEPEIIPTLSPTP